MHLRAVLSALALLTALPGQWIAPAAAGAPKAPTAAAAAPAAASKSKSKRPARPATKTPPSKEDQRSRQALVKQRSQVLGRDAARPGKTATAAQTRPGKTIEISRSHKK